MIVASVLTVGLALLQRVAAYDLLKTYSGNSFFDNWNYIDGWDQWTLGDVQYQNSSAAGTLTRVDSTTGNVRISMDDFTDLRTRQYDEKRPSIRLEGKDIFNGTNALLVFDVLHVPTGCSVWGSIWSKSALGPARWPSGGELDIFEAVNKMTANQVALHTVTSCTVPKPNSAELGQTNNADCQVKKDAQGGWTVNGSGCTVTDPKPESYSTLASSGGGVWVAEYSVAAINVWYFPRSSIPTDLTTANSIDTSTFGQPTANFPSAACDLTQAMDGQHLVINIAACGVWAGKAEVIQATCGQLTEKNCYLQYVKDPANYHDAYFEIASVKIFGDSNTMLQNSSSIAASTTTRAGSGGASTASGSASGFSVYTVGATTSASAVGTSTSARSGAIKYGISGAAILMVSGLCAAFL